MTEFLVSADQLEIKVAQVGGGKGCSGVAGLLGIAGLPGGCRFARGGGQGGGEQASPEIRITPSRHGWAVCSVAVCSVAVCGVAVCSCSCMLRGAKGCTYYSPLQQTDNPLRGLSYSRLSTKRMRCTTSRT